MTRDSALFKLLPIVSIVLATVAATTDPASLHLSPVVVNWIKLVSTIVAAITGWLGTSPLPGKNDPNVITLPR